MGFAETFKALSDTARRDILVLLKQERLSAGEIGNHFDMTGATISYHLSILKKAGLVYEQREKNFIYYELNTSVVEEVMLWLSDLKGGQKNGKMEEKEELYHTYKFNHFIAYDGGNLFVAKTARPDGHAL